MLQQIQHNRYLRHESLDFVGIEGQQKIRSAKVLIVGVGGLGTPAALYLTAAGIGTLGLIDSDTVSMTNLQRQILFSPSDEGLPKVNVAERQLKKINSDCKINIYQENLNSENAEDIVSNYDIIIDGSDNFSTKFLIAAISHKLKKPMIYGAVDRFEGQFGLFHSSQGPCYRCFLPEEPRALIKNCSASGVLGPLVGMIGTAQASLVLKWIISGGDPAHALYPPLGRIVFFQMDELDTLKLQVKKNKTCVCCSREGNEIPVQFSLPICSRASEVSWSEVQIWLKKNQVTLVDVREQSEWERGHLDGALHWPLSDLINGHRFGPIEKKIVLYCQKGVRSLQALELLQDYKGAPIFSLVGGIESVS